MGRARPLGSGYGMMPRSQRSRSVAAAGAMPAVVPPRLLKEEEAATYLCIPVAAVRRVMSGRVTIDGRVRWDRCAIDVWLDRESGLGAHSPDTVERTEAESALDAWIANSSHAARRP